MIDITRPRYRMIAIAVAWLCGLAMLLRRSALVRDASEELRTRWQWSDSIVSDLVRLTVELAILVLILRPNSYAQSWKRAARAVALFLPWTFGNFIVGQHGGPISAGHTFWLVWATVGMIGLTILSFAASRGLAWAEVLAASIIGAGVISFNQWVAAERAPSWMTPAIIALCVSAAAVLCLNLLKRLQPRRLN